jgi:hypothetical protein
MTKAMQTTTTIAKQAIMRALIDLSRFIAKGGKNFLPAGPFE